MQRVCLIVALAALLLLAGCKSSKTVPSHLGDYTNETMPSRQVFDGLANSYSEWQTLSCPLKVEIKEPKRFSVSGNVKVINGEVINVSLRVLGMEVGALYMDADSVIITSRLQKMAYAESTKDIMHKANFTLADVQSLFLGQVFEPQGGTIEPSDFKNFALSRDSQGVSLSCKKAKNNISWDFNCSLPTAEGTVPVLKSVSVAGLGKELKIAYNNHTSSEAGMIAQVMNAKTELKNRKVEIQTQLSVNKAQWNTPLTVSKPKISAGWTKISTEQLLSLLKKL